GSSTLSSSSLIEAFVMSFTLLKIPMLFFSLLVLFVFGQFGSQFFDFFLHGLLLDVFHHVIDRIGRRSGLARMGLRMGRLRAGSGLAVRLPVVPSGELSARLVLVAMQIRFLRNDQCSQQVQEQDGATRERNADDDQEPQDRRVDLERFGQPAAKPEHFLVTVGTIQFHCASVPSRSSFCFNLASSLSSVCLTDKPAS